MISLTTKAAEKVKGILDQEKASLPQGGLRIYVQGGGSSGFQYGMVLDEVAEDDEVFEFEGDKVIVDQMSLKHLDNATIDYKEDLEGAQFLVRRAIQKSGEIAVYRAFEGQLGFFGGQLFFLEGQLGFELDGPQPQRRIDLRCERRGRGRSQRESGQQQERTDRDPATWERVAVNMSLPTATRFLVVHIRVNRTKPEPTATPVRPLMPTGRLAFEAVCPAVPAAGRLLVAAPVLSDPNFARTVVLLLDHDDDGTLAPLLVVAALLLAVVIGSGVMAERLAALEEFQALGSGYHIAMRDLEIRGAGNLLGAQQSGHITAVGFDLYCQLLKQSV